jgi:hypothetical protein
LKDVDFRVFTRMIHQSVPKTFSTTSPGGKSGPTIH